mmetsp:Transcript_6652/g.15125  ORF Transcript_6652/g.15125 Transcript_6652/m.15125 type:complete len:106 (-) Transcript_6652:42-359(-)
MQCPSLSMHVPPDAESYDPTRGGHRSIRQKATSKAEENLIVVTSQGVARLAIGGQGKGDNQPTDRRGRQSRVVESPYSCPCTQWVGCRLVTFPARLLGSLAAYPA